jgi:hypothetical protein
VPVSSRHGVCYVEVNGKFVRSGRGKGRGGVRCSAVVEMLKWDGGRDTWGRPFAEVCVPGGLGCRPDVV